MKVVDPLYTHVKSCNQFCSNPAHVRFDSSLPHSQYIGHPSVRSTGVGSPISANPPDNRVLDTMLPRVPGRTGVGASSLLAPLCLGLAIDVLEFRACGAEVGGVCILCVAD
jgi:hypothetical protein